METIWLEMGLILILILANGFFAGAELAIVSVRRGRIAQRIAEGDERARIVEQLHEDPHRFLATVQIGVTLVGTMASAVGGVAAVEVIEPILQSLPIGAVSRSAEPLAILLGKPKGSGLTFGHLSLFYPHGQKTTHPFSRRLLPRHSSR